MLQEEFAQERDLVIGQGKAERERIVEQLDALSMQAAQLASSFEDQSQSAMVSMKEEVNQIQEAVIACQAV